jgi:CheY-like chemotaxis protein
MHAAMERSGTIVVYADDDELVRDTIAACLDSVGWRVYTCADGAQAITLCEAIQPDAVLLDVNMPGVDGFEAATRLLNGSACRPASIVAITGRATDQNMQRALSSGFDAVLAKPFQLETLLAALLPPAMEHGTVPS